MSPRSELDRGTLFARDELPPPEVVDGCFTSAITAIRRVQSVLDLAPPGALARLPRLRLSGILLELDRLTYRLRAEHPRRRQ